ncbi:MAG: WbuC family cupin fold metalloprotein [Nanoarchaeota archaeon]
MIVKGTMDIVEETLVKARISNRRRAIYCFHKSPDETPQRMINAFLEGTYARPHKHENPDKLETFTILSGDIAVLTFDNLGNIEDKVILSYNGKNKIAEIPPRTWHSLVVLSQEAAVYEIIEGKYNPMTHKDFAPWAPSEEDSNFRDYLGTLRNAVSS